MEGWNSRNKTGTTGTTGTLGYYNSSKKQIYNDLQYFKQDYPQDAITGKRDRMYQNPALAGVGRHARAPLPDAFPPTGRPCRLHGIPVPRPHLEGIVRADG